MKPGRFAAIVLAAAVLVVLPAAANLAPAATPDISSESPLPLTAPATTITVDSTSDPTDSDSTTCSTVPCTLRRAVVQARNAVKPVLINFNIPNTDPGYDAVLQIWKIQFSYISTDGGTLRYLNGGIIIDGSTQPGGRASGPKIILVGLGTGQNDGIKIGQTATQNGNELRGLGFQNFKTHVYVNSSSNLIVNNWFGLNNAGTGVSLRLSGFDDDGSGNTGVSISAGAGFNTLQNNVFTGLAGVAAAINGDDNAFTGNYVGTRADGTVPDKQTTPSLICTQVDWLGGSGISIAGDRTLVQDNIFAGLRIAVDPPTTQADTIRLGADHTTISNNRIGVDNSGATIGVCGRGIYLLSGTELNQITGNTIANPGLSGISLNDTPVVSTSDANTLRTNIIRKSTPWGQIVGSQNAEDAIQVTKSMPDAFRNFKPAKVTSISGTSVSGTSGTGSLCPNCVVELFTDDGDVINEALASLAVVTADASGNWAATLAAPLASGIGLRTTSTTAAFNTIAGMGAGTTTGLSERYIPTFWLTLASTGANDGWVLESTEKSSRGGSRNVTAATISLGDDKLNRQYRGILHFDTAGLPDNAVVITATLKIKKQKLVGNPFSKHGNLLADIRKPFFGPAAGLAIGDFQAAATQSGVATFPAMPVNLWYSAPLSANGKTAINRTGTTQFRLRFAIDDDNDHVADYLAAFSGNAPAAARPQLTINYYIP